MRTTMVDPMPWLPEQKYSHQQLSLSYCGYSQYLCKLWHSTLSGLTLASADASSISFNYFDSLLMMMI
jgi:hypothetical protein